MSAASDLRGVPGVCELEVVRASEARPPGPPALLVEVPHGATRESHFDALRRRLRSDLPDDLREFFFVNTDVGAPECARAVARLYALSTGRDALVLRGLLPRTFVDCNRTLGPVGARAMTPAIPDYVTAGEDVRLLEELHGRYATAATEAFEAVCAGDGTALILHTYAPRSVGIERIDGSIVARLRDAYRPERFLSWPLRPPVDVISESEDGVCLAPRALVAAVVASYEADGIRPEQNGTYRLSAETEGFRHSARHPGRVLCLEIRRDLLADPFTPFAEMRIGEAQVERMARPLARALAQRAGR